MPRKNHSLFGKELKKSLILEQVWLKSEELPEFKKFYVDNGNIDRLNNNSNQLVVGRRGTGKTHLLGTFHELVHSDKKYKDDFSIFISILEVRPQTPPIFLDKDADFTAKRIAKELFASFLKILFDRLLLLTHARLRKMEINSSEIVFRPIWTEVNHKLTELLAEIETGSAYELEKRTKTEIKTETKGNGSVAAAASVGLKNLSPSLSANLGASAGGNSESAEIENTEITSVFATDLVKVRFLIHDILALLGIERLFILIDEWMELEKRTPSQIQPHFAQILKTTFFNSQSIAVKIASVWHQTSLYDKGDMEHSIGIETGHDIIIAADLDTSFLTSEEDVNNFCKMLLFKRVEHVCAKISSLNVDGKVDDVFITEIFDSEDNFKMFISASHGIPRDLMNMFQSCSIRINRDFENDCINSDVISDISRKIYRTDKRKRVSPNSDAQKLLIKINNYMEKFDRRLFLVLNEETNMDAIRKLVDEELIHQIPSAIVHRDVSDEYKAYHIDFGNYVDFIEARKYPIERLLDEVIIPTFPDKIAAEIESYRISLEEFSKDIVHCGGCGHKFPFDHPVFVNASICPSCAHNDF